MENNEKIKYDEFKMQAALHGAEIKDDPWEDKSSVDALIPKGATVLSNEDFIENTGLGNMLSFE